MVKKVNNKGYMLVEIVLASALAMVVAYFMIDLTIKLKNKNDDLLVKTLTSIDQTIAMNELMELAMNKEADFKCNLLTKEDNKIFYDGKLINVINDYAEVLDFGSDYCDNDGTTISINIPVDVKQMPDDDFDIRFEHKYVTSYAVLYENKSLVFYKDLNEPSVGDTHNGNVVRKVYKNFESSKYNESNLPPWYDERVNIMEVEVNSPEKKIAPESTAYWFYGFINCEFFDLNDLNFSNVTDMEKMFYNAGKNVNIFILNVKDWDVSNVTNMDSIFYGAGYNATSWEIRYLNTWDVSNVKNMSRVFNSAGYNATSFSLIGLDDWNVSNVINMYNMFNGIGYNATESWEFSDLSDWDVSKVENMEAMFANSGYKTPNWNIGDLSSWNVSKVINMRWLFQNAGRESNTFKIEGISGWNVSHVKNMNGVFEYSGSNATSWEVGDLSGWNVSSVTDMSFMFRNSGYNALNWNIGNISGWNTSNVENMYYMFHQAGFNSVYSLNLSEWNVSKVTDYTDFDFGVTNKIIDPNWSN